jgi:hypothetical protein
MNYKTIFIFLGILVVSVMVSLTSLFGLVRFVKFAWEFV